MHRRRVSEVFHSCTDVREIGTLVTVLQANRLNVRSRGKSVSSQLSILIRGVLSRTVGDMSELLIWQGRTKDDSMHIGLLHGLSSQTRG